tara:strand:+ start:644 stop:1174 length:531 start_codon:yes stop_codon:yes gene_type:complete
MSELTDKQERFCLEYVIDFNATRAAKEAGYSEKTATDIGSQNLAKLGIQARLKELKKKSIEKLDTTHTDILNQLKNWAYSDITETIELTAQEIKELPLAVRQLITKFKRTTKNFDGGSEEVVELHFVSKEKAIEMIAKHIGFFEVDNKQKESNVVQSLVISDNIVKEINGDIESEC